MPDPFRDQLQTSLGAAYTLERELGGGGMARVFRARDEELGRDVVVKVLAPELAEELSAERSAREIRLAARLQHPNIVPVLAAGSSAGVPHYVMPFVQGDSLRARMQAGRVGLPEAASILRDVAKALAYSHRLGVVHRDVKPENVLLTDGTAVVTDFGVAKAISVATTRVGDKSAGGVTSALTRLGASVGTPAYMSPEQAAGDPDVGISADLYSWGIVAWELLAGRHPFADKQSVHALVVAHLMESPPSLATHAPSVPASLVALIERCLAKDPDARPERADALFPALEATLAGVDAHAVRQPHATIGRPAAARIAPAIAVMPFANLSKDAENEYLSDGITDEIIGTLGRIPGLLVAGRASCFALKGRALEPRAVGEQLNVTSVVDGSVRRAGNRVRVQAELVNAGDSFQLWSERYDRELSDVFALQDEIAGAIASALRGRLQAAGVARPAPASADPEAYELFLKGRHAMLQRTIAGSAEAVRLLEQAVALDPRFARAWAGLADAYLAAPVYHGADPAVAWTRARDAARRALALDEGLVEARTSLAYGTMLYEWDWASAEASFRRAVSANEGYPTAHHWYADFLAGRGRLDEALREMTRASQLDPLSPIIGVELGWVLGLLGRNDDALAQVDRVLRLEPNALLVRGGTCRPGRARRGLRVARARHRRARRDAGGELLRSHVRCAPRRSALRARARPTGRYTPSHRVNRAAGECGSLDFARDDGGGIPSERSESSWYEAMGVAGPPQCRGRSLPLHTNMTRSPSRDGAQRPGGQPWIA